MPHKKPPNTPKSVEDKLTGVVLYKPDEFHKVVEFIENDDGCFLPASPFVPITFQKSNIRLVKNLDGAGFSEIAGVTDFEISKYIDVVTNVDHEGFQKLLKSGSINFLTNTYGENSYRDYFAPFKPLNYDNIIDERVALNEIDLDYVSNKFNLMMKLLEYYSRFKFHLQLEYGFITSYNAKNEDELKSHQKFLSHYIMQHEKSYSIILGIYTFGLVDYFQDRIYEIELLKRQDGKNFSEQERAIELEKIKRDEANKLSPEMIDKLSSMQLGFKIFATQIENFKGLHFRVSLADFMEDDPNIFTMICRGRAITLNKDIAKVMEISSAQSRPNIKFSLLSAMMSNGLRINEFGTFFKECLQSIKTHSQSFFINLSVLTNPIVCYGYSKSLKVIPDNQLYKLRDSLLCSKESNFRCVDFGMRSENYDQFSKLPENFNSWLSDSYFRLNIYEFFNENTKEFNVAPHLDFPVNYKKNLWNLVLFTRDVEAIENFPLHLLSHNDYVSKENAMELFFSGKSNNSVKEEDNVNIVKKLISFGFGFNQNLKLGNSDNLREKIATSISPKGFEGLTRAINMVSDFELELMEFVVLPDKIAGMKSSSLYTKIEKYLEIYQAHLQTDPNNVNVVVEKNTTQDQDSLENFLNLTGFLTHLTSTGFIANLSLKTDKSSKELLKKIDKLTENLDEKSKILEEKKSRDADNVMRLLLEGEEMEKELVDKRKAEKLRKLKELEDLNKIKQMQEKDRIDKEKAEQEKLERIKQDQENKRLALEAEIKAKQDLELERLRILQLENSRIEQEITFRAQNQFCKDTIDDLMQKEVVSLASEVANEVLSEEIAKSKSENLLVNFFNQLQFFQPIFRSPNHRYQIPTFSNSIYLTKHFINPYSSDCKVLSSTEMIGEIIKSSENVDVKKRFLELMADNLILMLQMNDNKAEFNPLLKHILQVYKFHLDFTKSTDPKNMAIVSNSELPDFRGLILKNFITDNHENILNYALNLDEELFKDLAQNGIKINQNILKKIYEKNSIDLFSSLISECPHSIELKDIHEFKQFLSKEDRVVSKYELDQRKSFLKEIENLPTHQLSQISAVAMKKNKHNLDINKFI